MYDDKFVTQRQFSWMTKHPRTLKSKEIIRLTLILYVKYSLYKRMRNKKILLFRRCDTLEMPIQTEMKNKKGKIVPVVNYQLVLDKPVEDKLYTYIITKTSKDDEIEQ
jgi:hypothetical protein